MPLPQPSKEQHGVIAALGDAQRDSCRDTTHKETQARALLCRAGPQLAPSTSPMKSPGPVMLRETGSLGLHHPRVRLAARTSPSSCCDPRTTLEAQTGAEPPPAPACPERGHQHARSLSQGGCYNGIYTTERLQLLCEHKSWIQLSSAASPVRSGAAGVGGKAAGQVSSAAMPGGVSGPGGSRSPACPRVQGAGGCPGPAPP